MPRLKHILHILRVPGVGLSSAKVNSHQNSDQNSNPGSYILGIPDPFSVCQESHVVNLAEYFMSSFLDLDYFSFFWSKVTARKDYEVVKQAQKSPWGWKPHFGFITAMHNSMETFLKNFHLLPLLQNLFACRADATNLMDL